MAFADAISVLLLTRSGNRMAEMITVLVIFVVVLGATLWVTRWIAKYQKGQKIGSGIEIVESCPIGNGKMIQVVRIGETYVAIASCKDTVTKLAEIPADQIQKIGQEGSKDFRFQDLFKIAKKNYSEAEASDEEDVPGDEKCDDAAGVEETPVEEKTIDTE